MENVPVADTVVVDKPVVTSPQQTFETPLAGLTKAVSPAQDLRNIQNLIVNGIFPGNVAPEVVKAYKLLEDMAQVVEKAATDAK